MKVSEYIKALEEASKEKYDKEKQEWELEKQKEIKKCKSPHSLGYPYYYENFENFSGPQRINLGRQCDDLTIQKNYQNVIAELENEFGWAFIIKTKTSHFCFLLMKPFMRHTGTYSHNILMRFDAKEFLSQFENKLTIYNQEEFHRFKKGLIYNKLIKKQHD